MFDRPGLQYYSCPAFQCTVTSGFQKRGANATIPLSSLTRIATRAWIVLPLCALGFFVATSAVRLRRVEYVSEAAGRTGASGDAPATPHNFDWWPQLIVPGHHNESFEWLDQTRQMFARKEWRVRQVAFENAPFGHEVFASSPYRWWLGLVAWCNHEINSSPEDRAVERAALYADPLLLLLFGAGTTIFVALRFGVLAAALLSVGLVTLFPFSTEYLPGVPDNHGLAQAFALWSVLLLTAGARVSGADGKDGGRRMRQWFFAAGVAGALGLWVSVSNQAPILAGITLGALMAAWTARIEVRANHAAAAEHLPWRAWAIGGAVTCLAAYLAEFFPDHMASWELRAIHPLFGLAWLGIGELLARLTPWIQGEKPRLGSRDKAILWLAAASIASVPITMRLNGSLEFLTKDLPSMRLSMLPDGVSAPNILEWILQNGINPAFVATILPLLLVAPAVWIIGFRKFGLAQRMALAVSLGPVLALVGFACWQINWWNCVDSAVLAAIVATAGVVSVSLKGRFVPMVSSALVAIILLAGAMQLWPTFGLTTNGELTKAEVVGLIERDLAYWLAKHTGSEPAIVLAPPDATTALYYYGGISGLGTFGWENQDGLASAIRITSASTPEEAQELIDKRGVTHIIIPQWDPYMDVYAQLGSGQVHGTFLERLHQWNLPPWLRPVPYLIPTIAGFEGQSVIVFKVVDGQDDATAASRLAEYFVDMGQLDLASRAATELRRFPADLGALLSRAQVAIAEGDSDEFARATEVLLRRISGGSDRTLPWDQRVGLAVVLAQAHHVDLARSRLRQCLDEVDEEKLRSLSTNLLYRLQEARQVLGLEIADPHLQETALDLLPSDLRRHFEK